MSQAAAVKVIRSAVEGASTGVRCLHPAGLIDVGEAARRAINSEHYDNSREPAAVKAWVHRLAAKVDDSDRAVRIDGKLWLHPSIHPALAELPERDRQAQGIRRLPSAKRSRALAKVRAVRDYRRYCQHGNGRGLGKTIARWRFVEERRDHYNYIKGTRQVQLGLSVGSLKRWERLYREGGADAVARDGRGKGGNASEESDEAIALYWTLRNAPKKRTIAQCFRLVAGEAHARGWQWFSSQHTCSAWDRRNRNQRALILNREGEQRYTQLAGQYIELDPESFAPGECWNGDDHTLNAWVRLPNGKVVRPVLSAWQDWRSRTITGFRIVNEGTEHSILLAFADGADGFGLPSTIIADNGKAYTSWQWRANAPRRRTYRQAGDLAEKAEGIFALCDITASWALPFNPNAKRIERWFRTLDEQCVREMPSYCGRCPEDRPEAHAKLVHKAVEWDRFVQLLTDYVKAFNNAPHSGEGMSGRTPLQVMGLAQRKRLLDDNIRPLLLASWQRPVSIGRNGVAIRIAGTAVRYGATEPALRELAIGTKVRVAYDPADTRFIAVWTMDYRWICRAELNQRFNRAIPTEALREAMRKKSRDKRTLRKARAIGLEHMRDPMEMAVAALSHDADKRRLPDPPGPEGGPILVPVQTPLEAPREPQILRKAVGAEDMDILERFDRFAREATPTRKPESVWAAFERFARGQGGAE